MPTKISIRSQRCVGFGSPEVTRISKTFCLNAALLLLIFALQESCFSTAWAQSSLDSSRSMGPMQSVLPLFLYNEKTSSKLILVNAASTNGSVTVTLRDTEGHSVYETLIEVGGDAQQEVSFEKFFQKTGIDAFAGSVVITPDMSGEAIVGSLAVTIQAPLRTSYVDEELVMLGGTSSRVLRAITPESTSQPIVAITSMSTFPQQLVISCISAQGPLVQRFTLSAAKTTIFRPCRASGAVPASEADLIPELSHAESSKTDKAVYGVEVRSETPSGSIAAFALSANSEEGTLSFRSVPFVDPLSLRSATSVFTGVPVGDVRELPRGSYRPRLTLANFADKIATFTIQEASSSDANSRVAALPLVHLGPRQTLSVDLSYLLGRDGLRNSFLVSSDLEGGQAIASLMSSNRGLDDVQMMPKDRLDPFNAGSHPWSLEQDSVSTLLLFNPSNDYLDTTFQLQAGYPLYTGVLRLKPWETKQVDIGPLLLKHSRSGVSFPLKGEVQWSSDSNKTFGRLLVSNPGSRSIRSFSCGNEHFVCGSSIQGTPSQSPVGQSVTIGPIAPLSCVNANNAPCAGQSSSYNSQDYSYQWANNDGNSSINGNNTGASVVVIGRNGGSTSVRGTITDGYTCSSSSTSSFYVQTPSANPVASTSTNSAMTSCGTGQAGWQRLTMRQIVDLNGNAVVEANQSVPETLTPVSGKNGLNLTSMRTGTGVTNASGQYQDFFSFCSPGCPGKNTSTFNQQNTDTLPGPGNTTVGPYSLSPNTLVYACSQITVNGK